VWADHPELVKETLVMLATMVHGASDQGAAARVLLGLDVTRALFAHHTSDALPFLAHQGNARHRTTFYLTLTHLLSLNEADVDASGAFESFLQPILSTLDQLANAPSLRTDECRRAIIGVTRDLRGITCASNHRLFPLLFDLLYPRHLPLLTRALETWHDAPDVTNSVLKLWMELSENKDGRIKFDGAFPGGLLLFKELAASVQAYGRAVLAQPELPDGADAYKTRYKGVGVCLAALALALTGDYVDLGAFTLYGDTVVDDVMGAAMQMALAIPTAELLAFHKVAFAFYSLAEALFRQAISLVVAMETSTVVALLQALHHGLANALQQNLHILCARAIDRFASFLYRTRLRNTPCAPRPALLSSHLGSTARCPGRALSGGLRLTRARGAQDGDAHAAARAAGASLVADLQLPPPPLVLSGHVASLAPY
jgi:exportin-7